MTIPKLARHANDIYRLYREGTSATAIGRQYNVTTTTVTKLLKDAGLMRARKRGECDDLVVEHRKKAVQMFNDGFRPSEIERELGRSKSWVFKQLNDSGCELRGLDGWKPDKTSIEKVALARERAAAMTESEKVVYNMLTNHGLEVTPQMAFGTKNIDFAIHSHSVAIEVYCRTVGRLYINNGGLAERVKELGESGWSVYVLFAHEAKDISLNGIDDMLAWIDFTERSPAILREYRMVRCPSKLISCGKIKGNDLSTIFSSVDTR